MRPEVKDVVYLSKPADAQVAGAVARRMALEAGASPKVAVEFATVAAELAANAVHHGGGGTMKCRAVDRVLTCEVTNAAERDDEPLRGRIEAARRDVEGALRGLGAVTRMADDVQVSLLGHGRLVVCARRSLDERPGGFRAR